MKIDENKRQTIESRKEAEKKQALEEIFKPAPPKPAEKASKRANEIWDDSELVEEPQALLAIGSVRSPIQHPDDEGMDESALTETQPSIEPARVSKVIPAVRSVQKSEPIKLEFTERIFPTLAMRETQLKEAPAPKLRKLAQKMDKNMDSTLKSPIWLKDKGDEFLQAGDIASAIDAYNNAIKLDPTYWAAYSNRSICHLQLSNIEDCAQDCGFLLAKFIEMEKSDQLNGQIHRLREKVYLRALTCEALLGHFQQFKELAKVLLNESIISEANKEHLRKDLETVEQREESFRLKAEADSVLRAGKYDEAKQLYLKILETFSDDQLNDRVSANLSFCEIKMGLHEQAIGSCSHAINLIQSKMSKNLAQTSTAKHITHFKNLLIKLLMRRAVCYEEVGQPLDAEADLRSILLLDERNEEARQFRKRLATKREYQEALHSKQAGDQALREGSHSEALDKYRSAIATFDPSKHVFDYLAVLLNMSVCHTSMNMTEEVLTDCIKGLRVLEKINNSVIKLSKDTWTPEERTKLLQMELRFYMRRANAFLQKGQIYHAKSDFQAALKLDPQNKEIQQNLDKITIL